MRLPYFTFWKRWLVHSLSIWLIGSSLSFCNFLYKKSIWGNYLHYADGTPVTVWDRFIAIFSNLETIYLIVIGALLVEINYQYFFKKSIWVFVATSVLNSLMIAFVLHYNYLLLHGPKDFSLETIVFLVPYALIYPLLPEFIQKRIFKAERLYEQSRSELNALRAQINPHFFFNTLNGLYGTALREKAKDTSSGIELLAGMMRYILTEGSTDFVPITSELKFLNEYIELQRIRLPAIDTIKININIQYDKQHAVVAPLLFMPLLENAFQYGISIESESFITLHIRIEQKTLEFFLENSISMAIKNGTGIGIENVKRRLELLYPGKHQLEITKTATIYKVRLKIDL